MFYQWQNLVGAATILPCCFSGCELGNNNNNNNKCIRISALLVMKTKLVTEAKEDVSKNNRFLLLLDARTKSRKVLYRLNFHNVAD